MPCQCQRRCAGWRIRQSVCSNTRPVRVLARAFIGPFATTQQNSSQKRRRPFGGTTSGSDGRSLISLLAFWCRHSFCLHFLTTEKFRLGYKKSEMRLMRGKSCRGGLLLLAREPAGPASPKYYECHSPGDTNPEAERQQSQMSRRQHRQKLKPGVDGPMKQDRRQDTPFRPQMQPGEQKCQGREDHQEKW